MLLAIKRVMAGTCTVWDSVADPATGNIIRECVSSTEG